MFKLLDSIWSTAIEKDHYNFIDLILFILLHCEYFIANMYFLIKRYTGYMHY